MKWARFDINAMSKSGVHRVRRRGIRRDETLKDAPFLNHVEGVSKDFAIR